MPREIKFEKKFEIFTKSGLFCQIVNRIFPSIPDVFLTPISIKHPIIFLFSMMMTMIY